MKYSVLLILGGLSLGLASDAHAQNIKTVAGDGTAGSSPDGTAATAAKLSYPSGVAVDAAGNLYIADANNNRVRKVSAAGIMTTIAGNGTSGYAGDGGAATAAQLKYPTNVAVDNSGNVYIADYNNQRIRKVTPAGIITTIAGDGTIGNSGDGGSATAANLHNPMGLHADNAGNVYISDMFNNRVRKVDASGIITNVAGTGMAGYDGDGGSAGSARLTDPAGVGRDAAGNIYIADKSNHCIRKVSASTGFISTVAGVDTAGFTGDGGAATVAKLNKPTSVKVDKDNNIFFVDMVNNRIRKVTPAGIISTVAGAGSGYGGDGGPATAALLNFPQEIAIDAAGNVYIADAGNNRVRKITFASAGVAHTATPAGRLEIFPNPAAGKFSVQLPADVRDAFVTIQDLSGRVVEKGGVSCAGGLASYSMLAPAPGIFIVRVVAGNNVYTGRLQIQ